MKLNLTRREFARLATASACALAVGRLATSQERRREAVSLDEEVELMQSKLAEPLAGEALEIARKGLARFRSAGKSRWNFRLPETSEPCTIFIPRTSSKIGM